MTYEKAQNVGRGLVAYPEAKSHEGDPDVGGEKNQTAA